MKALRLCIVACVVLGLSPGWAQDVRLVTVADGLNAPIGIRDAGDGSGRLFVVERAGRVLILRNGTVAAAPFLELDDVGTGGEGGLLGLAFDPGFPSNGYLFVHYTRDAPACGGPELESVVARFTVSAGNPDEVDPSSRQGVLALCQPRGNHNGGDVAFGPDGHLYVSLGDGGGSGDPEDNGQDTNNLFGSILRFDIDPLPPTQADPLVPSDNPFVGVAGADEIWVFGLRNPYRISFDRLTGDLLIADVGQGEREEVDRVPFESDGGLNFGWPCREGTRDYDPGRPSCQGAGPFTEPVLEYSHDNGDRSITGGYRYANAGPLHGLYLFGDFGSGRLWAATPGSVPWSFVELESVAPSTLVGFGQDAEGNVYVATFAGTVSRILGQSEIFSSGFESGSTSFWSTQTP